MNEPDCSSEGRGDELPWDRIARWLAGEMDAAERAEFERWIAAVPGRAAVIAALRAGWTAAGTAGDGWDAEAMLRRIKGRDAPRRVERPPAVALPQAGSRWRATLGLIAAAATVAAGVLLDRRFEAPPAAESPSTEYRTPRGQRMVFTLADGTEVTLAPSSVLRRPSRYGEAERFLELEGEAYFDVAADSTPFAVKTERFVARDIGTRFGVRAYADEPASRVMVSDGEVIVALVGDDSARAVMLRPGDVGTVDGDGQLTRRQVASLDPYLAWVEGRLVFVDTPLGDVATQLSRWFDVSIRIAGGAACCGINDNELSIKDMASRRLTASFALEPIGTVLAKIAGPLHLSVESRGREFVLRDDCC